MSRLKKIQLTPARKKQLIIFGMVILTGVGISVLWSGQSNSTTQSKSVENQKTQKATTTNFTKTNDLLSDRDAWQNSTGQEVKSLDQRIADLETKLQSSSKLQNPEANENDPFGKGGLPPPPPNDLPNVKMTNGNLEPSKPLSQITSVDIALSPSAQAPSDIQKGGSTVKRADDFKKKTEASRVKGIRPNIEVYTDGGDVTYTSSAKFRVQNTYIPSGTFFRVVLLGGVDAPTGGEAASANPHPVLMRVIDLAKLPNLHRFNVKECFVLGTAYGDISAERAYIRTERMSCVDQQGRAIDMKIKGWVTGEDGKAGMRGQLITKQGQMLANALMVSIISGAGKGLADSYKTTSTSAFGTTSSVKSGNEFKSAFAQSAGDATQMLVQYYIKLAEKTFPVVEINAGRIVDVVLLEGIQIQPEAQ